jgi:transposase
MTAPARYFDLVREMNNAYNHRLRLVESARQRGLKPTARLFATTVPTVRKWLRRFQQHGPSGLLERSRAPHRQARQTSPEVEQQVVALRQQLPTFGARRLIREFDLPLSHRALERIWRAQGLLQKRKKKYQRKQDLAHIKAQWALFQQISADTKDLDDIPHYWPQAQQFGLPGIQYTAREVRSGALFWAFAEKRSAAASAVFASRIQQHLDRYGICLRDLVWQTDNGGEFKGDSIGSWRQQACTHPASRATRATWKPYLAEKRTSSLISKTSPVAASSSPKCIPTSCTSILLVPTPSKKIKVPGRSSSA